MTVSFLTKNGPVMAPACKPHQTVNFFLDAKVSTVCPATVYTPNSTVLFIYKRIKQIKFENFKFRFYLERVQSPISPIICFEFLHQLNFVCPQMETFPQKSQTSWIRRWISKFGSFLTLASTAVIFSVDRIFFALISGVLYNKESVSLNVVWIDYEIEAIHNKFTRANG